MSTSTTWPTGSLTRPAPAGRGLGEVGSRGAGRGTGRRGVTGGRGGAWPASSIAGAVRWTAVVLLATGVVVMHAVLGLGPASQATTHASTPAITDTTGSTSGSMSGASSDVSPGASPGQVSHESGQAGPSGHDCVHCRGADHAMSLGHLCLAIVGGLLLAGAAVWGRRRHRLPVLDLDVRRSEQGCRLPARAVLGVPAWSHLSLAQLSLLRV